MRSTHTLANAIHAARLGATVAVTALRHPGETLVLTWGRKGISVVGASGTILKTTDGGITWSTETSNTTKNLNYQHVLDSTHMWAVGATGTIDFFNGTTWATQTSNTATNLNAVWVFKPPSLWANTFTGFLPAFKSATRLSFIRVAAALLPLSSMRSMQRARSLTTLSSLPSTAYVAL